MDYVILWTTWLTATDHQRSANHSLMNTGLDELGKAMKNLSEGTQCSGRDMNIVAPEYMYKMLCLVQPRHKKTSSHQTMGGSMLRNSECA
jgi:hypothetical protein